VKMFAVIMWSLDRGGCFQMLRGVGDGYQLDISIRTLALAQQGLDNVKLLDRLSRY